MAVNAASSFNGGSVAARAEYFCGADDDQGASGPGREDYYVGAVDDLGGSGWIGSGAEKLGLRNKPLSTDDFAKVFGGIDPSTGERFDGKGRDPFSEDERAGYEMALNVDKSISVLYAIGGDEDKMAMEKAILKAHDSMFNYAVDNGYFKVRTGAQGKGPPQSVEDVTAARFLHGTNRNQDPHLHVHCEISAVVFDDRGKAKKLDALDLFKRQKEMAFIFDSYLAENLNELGISLKENAHGLAVKGINEDCLKGFSTRRNEINEAMERMGEATRGNRDLNVNVTMSGRAEKADALDKGELYDDWKARALEFGYSASFIAEQSALGHDFRDFAKSDELESLLLAGNSVFTAFDFDRVAAQFSIGRGGPEAINEIKHSLIEKLEIERLPNSRFTTRKVIESEKAIMKSAIGRAGEAAHTIGESKVTAVVEGIRHAQKEKAIDEGRDPESVNGLNIEQERAVYHLANESGGIAVLEGAAGTGKSFTMAAVKQLFEGDGFKVTGLAPSGKAADELEAGSGIKSRTMHSLLINLESGKASLSSNDVLVLDEAGMADSIALARLTDYAHEAGTKLILTGDNRQLNAVGTANLLKEVGEEIGRADLAQIARQKDPALAAISQALFENDRDTKSVAWAMGELSERGRFHHIEEPEQAVSKCVDLYLEKAGKHGHDDTLLLARTNEKVAILNDEVRGRLMKSGDLDASKAVALTLEDDRGAERKTYVMPGDRVMCRKNDQKLGVSNGTVGTVEKIENDTVTLKVDGSGDCVEIDVNEYRNLDLAWAMTVHKSQGMTVSDGVGLDLADLRLQYVNFTRGKNGMDTVSTQTLDDFITALERDNTKLSTISACGDRATGENPLLDAIQATSAASRTAVERSGQKDLQATNRVLADEFRLGVKGDLGDEWRGEDIALAGKERETAREWKERESERIRQREAERQAAEKGPEPFKGELDADDLTPDENQADEVPIIEDSEAEQASDKDSAADKRDDNSEWELPPPPPEPEPEDDYGPGMG